MGYTHYWHTEEPALDQAAFAAFSEDCIRLRKSVPFPICFGDDTPPRMDADEVQFNGVPPSDGYEQFALHRQARRLDKDPVTGKHIAFGFCKTAHRPYDLLVTACLIAAKKHFGADVTVSSDGDDCDWDAARELCSNVLGYGSAYHIQGDDRELGDYPELEDETA